MKKLLKIMACAMFVIAMAGTMSSCKTKYDGKILYSAGYCHTSCLTPTELGNMEDYIAQNALPINDVKIYSITSTVSIEDCYNQADEKAKADFAIATSKLSVEEAQKFLNPGHSYTYYWSRNVMDGEGQVRIGEWKCANPAN